MRGSSNRVLLAYAGLGLLAAGVVVLLPDTTARSLLYDGIAASAVIAIVIGLWLHKPANALPWMLIGLGVLAFVAGEVTWEVYSYLQQDPFPSIADFFYLSGYPLVAAGVLLLVRGRMNTRTLAQASLVDAAIVTVAAGVVSFGILARLRVVGRFVSGLGAVLLLASGAYVVYYWLTAGRFLLA